MASTTSRRGWASGRPPAAWLLVDLLVWLPKSLPGALFAAQTARHPAVTATVQPSAKAAQPTGSETGTKRLRRSTTRPAGRVRLLVLNSTVRLCQGSQRRERRRPQTDQLADTRTGYEQGHGHSWMAAACAMHPGTLA